ncbi:MAG TPA: ribbon-helix-helix domain-containing protein [Candidatus Acidoferrum sp.]|nr:ribbon-helix-helix domain-containing protein [Candidatus Acidoferrum sp.]
MKAKTSVTLSKDVLAQVDRLAGSKHSRSAFIERVLRRYLRERSRAALHARDLSRINRAADQLNREAAEVLEYQASDNPLQEDGT